MQHNILILFFLSINFAVAQNNYAGIYLGRNHEKDSIQNIPVQVQHKLILNTDSSFIYSKNSSLDHCNSTYAGYWKKNRETLVLSFLGEEPLHMLINEGAGFCSLENRKEQLSLVKQIIMQQEPYDPYKYNRSNRKKRKREKPCPRF